jgi:hypothetical protein
LDPSTPGASAIFDASEASRVSGTSREAAAKPRAKKRKATEDFLLPEFQPPKR